MSKRQLVSLGAASEADVSLIDPNFATENNRVVFPFEKTISDYQTKNETCKQRTTNRGVKFLFSFLVTVIMYTEFSWTRFGYGPQNGGQSDRLCLCIF